MQPGPQPPPGEGAMPAPPAPYPAYPPYPPPMYYPSPRRSEASTIILIFVIITVATVAVTGVMAAVLYVMVSGLSGGPPPAQTMVVSTSLSADGTNWTLDVREVPGGLTITGTTLRIRDSGGGTALPATSFAGLDYGRDGAAFSGDTDANVEVGEAVLVSASRYPAGSEVLIDGPSGLLWATVL